MQLVHAGFLRQHDDGGGLVHRAGPQADDGDGEQGGVDDGAAPVLGAEDARQRAGRLDHRLRRVLRPLLRLLHLVDDVQREDHRRQPAQEHGAPAVVRAHREVERGGEEEAGVVAGLQVARAHLAAVLRPGFGDIGAGQGPLAADADAGEQAEQAQLPHVLRQRRGAGEHRVHQHRGGQYAGAAVAVGDRAPDEGQAPADQEQREQHRADQTDVGGRAVHAGFGQQLGQGRAQHQGVDERVHAVEGPAGPGGPEAGALRLGQLAARRGGRQRSRVGNAAHLYLLRRGSSRVWVCPGRQAEGLPLRMLFMFCILYTLCK